MPVYEFYCERCQTKSEQYFHTALESAPKCPSCGGPRVWLPSIFATPFLGEITSRYKLRDREGSEEDGVWMYRKKTSLSGEPEPVYIRTWSELREFCRAEGLSLPGEVPTNATISPDGRKLSSAGMPGQWASFSPEVLPEKATAPPPPPEHASSPVEVVDRRELDPRSQPVAIPLDMNEVKSTSDLESILQGGKQ